MIAITGAGGYIGSRLATALLGQPVRALVRQRVGWLPDAIQAEVDVASDSATLAEDFTGASAVVHLAGHNEVVAAVDPDRALAETVLASRRVADAAAAAGVRRLVYVSTVHVYGARIVDGAELDEEIPAEPRSTYAIARLASEHLLAQAAAAGVAVTVLRLTNAVGAPAHVDVNRWTLVASDLCRQAATEGSLTLRSSGEQWRDFVSLDDVCRILAACCQPGGPPPGTYNLGSGHSLTVLQLARLVQDAFEARTGQRPPLHAPAHAGPRPDPWCIRVERLAKHGLTAESPLRDSIGELVAFCLEHRSQL